VVDNKSMTDVGNVWNPRRFDGKTFYVSRSVTPSNYVYYAYKLKGLKPEGKQSIITPKSCSVNSFYDKQVYIIPLYTDTVTKYAAFVYDKKLKKEQWNELPYAEGLIWKVGKSTLYRYTSSTSGDTVTRVYKLFNKKGKIVTYTYMYDK